MIDVAGPRRGVATVTLERVERRNALDLDGFRRLAAAWRALDVDPEVRVVVVTGTGGDFCSGADLAVISAEMSDAMRAGTSGRELWADLNDAVLRDARLAPPVIAAVEGTCFGAGMELVGATDIRVAAAGARFALPEVQHGVIASGGSLARLARQVSYAAAMQIVLTGTAMDATTMHRLGFVNEVVADGDALNAALEIARQIADNAPAAVRASKQVVRDSLDVGLPEALAREGVAARQILGGAEASEGTRAFIEKRPPAWRLD